MSVLLEEARRYRDISGLSDASCLSFRGDEWTYSDIERMAYALLPQVRDDRNRLVGTYLPDSPLMVALLVALDAVGAQVCLIDPEIGVARASALLDSLNVVYCYTDETLATSDPRFHHLRVGDYQSQTRPADHRDSEYGKVVLLTSGTTGEPKAVVHTWDSLASGVVRRDTFAGVRWLQPYGLTRFAGLQVFLQSFMTGGCLCLPDRRDTAAIAALLSQDNITHASGTPTLWRMLLHRTAPDERSRWHLQQLTLGGEAASQTLLDALHQAFPGARITHTYASTEAGIALTASDGRAGFARDLLENHPKGIQFKIVDDVLWVKSAGVMEGYLSPAPKQSEWVCSGDVVAIREDRLYILGRTAECINVGGDKVFPVEIEEELRRIQGVEDARVYAEKSSIIGQVVAADVVPSGSVDPVQFRSTIVQALTKRLDGYKIPRLIRLVSTVSVSSATKIARSTNPSQ